MFAFSQPEAQTFGSPKNIPVGLGEYLGASFDQGWYDSLFSTTQRLEEYRIATGGAVLSVEEANKRYQLPGLNFNEPINEERAAILHNRHKAQMEREFFLTEGHPGLLRKGAGFATSMVASMLNPLDLGLSFVPVVKGGEAANVLGKAAYRSTIRRALNEGFIDIGIKAGEKAGLARTLGASTINNALFQSVAEVPRFAEMMQTGRNDYTLKDSLTNIVSGTAMGVGIHMGVMSAAHVYRRLSPQIKEFMQRKAVDDFLKGKDTADLHEITKMDPNVVAEKVIFDEVQARKAAGLEVDKVLQDIHDKLLVEHAKTQTRSQEVWTKLLKEEAQKGGFTKRAEELGRGIRTAEDLANLTAADEAHRKEYARVLEIYEDPNTPGPEKAAAKQWLHENAYVGQMGRETIESAKGTGSIWATDPRAADLAPFTPEGTLKSEVANAVKAEILAKPEVREKIDAEIAARIEAYVAKERAKFEQEKLAKQNNGPNASIEKVTPDEEAKAIDVRATTKPGEETAAALARDEATFDADVQALRAELGVKDDATTTGLSEQAKKLDKALETLKVDLNRNMQLFGLLPATWNAVIDMIRVAVKAGYSVADIISSAATRISELQEDLSMQDINRISEYLKMRLNGMVTDIDVQLAQEKPFGLKPKIKTRPKPASPKPSVTYTRAEVNEAYDTFKTLYDDLESYGIGTHSAEGTFPVRLIEDEMVGILGVRVEEFGKSKEILRNEHTDEMFLDSIPYAQRDAMRELLTAEHDLHVKEGRDVDIDPEEALTQMENMMDSVHGYDEPHFEKSQLMKKAEILPQIEREALRKYLSSTDSDIVTVGDLMDWWNVKRPNIVIEQARSTQTSGGIETVNPVSDRLREAKSNLEQVIHELDTLGYRVQSNGPGDFVIGRKESPGVGFIRTRHADGSLVLDQVRDFVGDKWSSQKSIWERWYDLKTKEIEVWEEWRTHVPDVNPIEGWDDGGSDFWGIAAPKSEADFVNLKVSAPEKDVKAHLGKGVISWIRAYWEQRGEDRIFHVFEQQSDWAQDAGKGAAWDKAVREDPLIQYTTHLALKAAVNYAKKNGATHIAISTGDSAMWAEGHWSAYVTPEQQFRRDLETYEMKQRQLKLREMFLAAKDGDWVSAENYKDIRIFKTKEEAVTYNEEQKKLSDVKRALPTVFKFSHAEWDLPSQPYSVFGIPRRKPTGWDRPIEKPVLKSYSTLPDQAPGMYQHYDNTLPSLMQNLLKTKPEPDIANFGMQSIIQREPPNAYVGDVKSPSDTTANIPPADITARVFPLDKVPEDPVWSMFKNQLQNEPTYLDKQMILDRPVLDEKTLLSALECSLTKTVPKALSRIVDDNEPPF